MYLLNYGPMLNPMKDDHSTSRVDTTRATHQSSNPEPPGIKRDGAEKQSWTAELLGIRKLPQNNLTAKSGVGQTTDPLSVAES